MLTIVIPKLTSQSFRKNCMRKSLKKSFLKLLRQFGCHVFIVPLHRSTMGAAHHGSRGKEKSTAGKRVPDARRVFGGIQEEINTRHFAQHAEQFGLFSH